MNKYIWSLWWTDNNEPVYTAGRVISLVFIVVGTLWGLNIVPFKVIGALVAILSVVSCYCIYIIALPSPRTDI